MTIWLVTFSNFYDEDSEVDSVWDTEDAAEKRVEYLEAINRWVSLYKVMMNTTNGVEDIT